jgi:hypothetical protein
MNARTIGRLAVLALLVAASGCGPRLINVSGRLTYKGQPVPSTRVKFWPEDGGRPSHGRTNDNGEFTLKYSRTEPGVYRGTHTVILLYEMSTEEEQNEISPQLSKELKAILPKYDDLSKSPLHYEITSDGQFIEIQLE